MPQISTRVREVAVCAREDSLAAVLDSRQPAVIRGLVADWPSVTAGKDGAAAALDYLRNYARDQDVLTFRGDPAARGRYFYNETLNGFNFERVTTRLCSVLGELSALESSVGEAPPLYLGSTAIDKVFPGFRDSNDICLGDVAPLVSIWLGNRSRIAAHYDTPENIACVVAGQRRFTLFPPEQLSNLYVGPLDFTPAGQSISLVDFECPDYGRFPKFREALAAAQVAELEAGDALYLPSMWWHHVEAEAPLNILVNYWWNIGRQGGGNPLNALIHAMMTTRGLPIEQRRVWRDIFDHYVFGEHEGDFGHIPEDRLGVLGDLDADTIRRLRTVLRGKI